jgi:hypothetical protein
MRDAGRRPMGRLLYWYWAVVLTAGFWLPAFGLPAAPQIRANTTNTTTVSDTVFLADECLNASTWAKAGTPASSSGAGSN